jgi:hypothetical protein
MPIPQIDLLSPDATFAGRGGVPSRARVREVIRAAGGVVGAGRLATHPTAQISHPFGSAEPVEHRRIRAIPLEPAAPPANVGFLDGIQRFALEGHFGLAPVIRAYVSAVVLNRWEGVLRPAVRVLGEEFLVTPVSQLSLAQRKALESLNLEIHECPSETRAHPLLDIQRAVEEVEHRRESLEQLAAAEFADEVPDGWLVVDGAVTPVATLATEVVGVVKSHETQFLEGTDLHTALTLPCGSRTSIFSRTTSSGSTAHTWYLRLWPRDDQDLLHGLVRIERPANARTTADDADRLSGWLLSERAPLSSPDGRWDRLLYPIHMVENYLRARAGAWA